MKILIVEDDPAIRSLLERTLAEEGHLSESAADGSEGLYRIEMGSYDAVILDRMLPELDGVALLERIRRQGITTPVLMLTARGAVEERIEGLRAGADDYLLKPFSLEELLARLDALFRRSAAGGASILEAGALQADLQRRSITLEGQPLDLKHKEYELLLFLMRHAGSPVSNQMIEEQLWDSESLLQSNVIPVTIYNLRKKIGKERIRNSRGMGYILDA